MASFMAKVSYVDVRVISIEARDIEEATKKYLAGDWDDETTVEFYADHEIKPLHEVAP